MDEAGRMELIRELCSIEGRGPGTDAERRAANLLAERLRRAGRPAELQPTYVHPQPALVQALHAALAIAASLLATVEPGAGFALALAVAASTYLDLNTRLYLLRRLFFRRASQNVVSPGPRPDAPLRLVLVAHYDAGRSGFLFGERGLRVARRLGERGRLLLGPWRVLFWAGIVPLLPILGARMAGVEGQWLAVLQLLPTVLLAVAVLLLLDVALSDTVPGAYDNASGVAAALSVAQRLDAERPAHLDVWVLLTGAGESIAEGMRCFLTGPGRELDRERTVFVNLDSVSYGTPHYELSEGALLSVGLDPRLAERCEALASADPSLGARPLRSPLPSEATPAAIRRRRANPIRGLDGGLPPPWLHTHEDSPDRVVASALERATDFALGLAALLDREAGRADITQS